jgi:hypothetical protein
VAVKYIYVRLFRDGDRMGKKDFMSRGAWILIAAVLWVIAWVISEAIPNFNNLLALIVNLHATTQNI